MYDFSIEQVDLQSLGHSNLS